MYHYVNHDLWIHLGNVLFLLAYLVRDILWLRILTVVGTLCLMAYYVCCALYVPIIWNSLFTIVNVVQITLLIMERRPVFLGEDELRLYRNVFRTLTPREFSKLLLIADWKHTTEGEVLLEQDEPISQLALVSGGTASVEIDGRHIADVGPGQFIGEMGFLTQQPASASVVSRIPLDILSWPAERLREYLQDAPQLHVKFQGILGADLVEKLKKEGFASAHPSKIMDAYQQGQFE